MIHPGAIKALGYIFSAKHYGFSGYLIQLAPLPVVRDRVIKEAWLADRC